MSFQLKEIKNKKVWEGFLEKVEEKTFLQSWNWGEFNKKMGRKIYRFGIYNDKTLVATAFVFRVEARRGSFVFVPHGPNLQDKEFSFRKKIIKFLLKELQVIAKENNDVSVKIAPLWERNKKNKEVFSSLGFREAPLHVHPEVTWELPLLKKERVLLMNMRKTTRYLIRKGEKNNDLKVVQSKDIKDVEKFNNIYQVTKDRHDFTPFSLQYLNRQFKSFVEDDQISVFLAKYKGEVLSSGIFLFWNDIGFYHHGASVRKYSKIPSSYLMMWRAIQEAKKRGCKKFNFWGTAPLSESDRYDKKHPWAGLTLFKMGFGGRSRKYVKTQDFVISPRYWLSFLVEKARKVKRGL
jgi:lipid II:glycine glycyltransferase (peptidoglycan interpeptide bridge formation enzyme)